MEPMKRNTMLSDYELERYKRQLLLPDFGEIGQMKIRSAKVLVVGLGGLGSVVSLYLTAAGFVRIGLMDNDVVSLHNLQRQVLYREDEIGQSKLILSKKTLARLNKQVQFDTYNTFLNKENAAEIVSKYDIIIDCTDNYEARYTINDACVQTNKPFVYGSIENYTGQMAVLNYGKPCATYRTLFPNEKVLLNKPKAVKGVMGILPSVIASLQVNEAVKITADIGEVMKDTLFTIDLLTLQTHKFKIPTK